jgi:hypothetical protein
LAFFAHGLQGLAFSPLEAQGLALSSFIFPFFPFAPFAAQGLAFSPFIPSMPFMAQGLAAFAHGLQGFAAVPASDIPDPAIRRKETAKTESNRTII